MTLHQALQKVLHLLQAATGRVVLGQFQVDYAGYVGETKLNGCIRYGHPHNLQRCAEYGKILVHAWIELHRDELAADWEIAVSGENPYKIEPL